MNWCFAVINGRLAELFFHKNRGRLCFLGHCYVKRRNYSTIKEREMIDKDVKKNRFSYKREKYLTLT